jgi:hypothetical protein
VEAALGSSSVEAAHHVEADVGVEVALDSDGGEVALRSSGMGQHQAHGGAGMEVALGSSGMGRHQAHGGAGMEVALGSSDVEATHHVEVDFCVEVVLDSDGGEVASRWAQI